jgi:Leucine-rich repeat (LRR) protein
MARALVWRFLALLVVGLVVEGDPAGDRLVLQQFKAGITNSAGLGWTDPDPCQWDAKMVKCDAAGNVQQLRVRDLGLTGEVTPTLNQLTQLTYLELNFNAFTGAMPSLAGLSMLQWAFLDDNDFTSLPPDCFHNLSSIVELHVENNQNLNKSVGGWTIPASLELATTLTVLSVTNASVTGPLPSFLGTLPALRTLEASYNNLMGGIPESFQTSSIQVLKLNNQQMNGSVAAVGGMVGLQFLWLQVNNFFGPVPLGLESAAGLTSLRINDNQLVGRLPLGLASLQGLTEVLMAKNALSGELPPFAATVTTTFDSTTFCGAAGVKCSVNVESLLDFLGAAGWPQQVAVTWVGPDPCTGWIGVSCDPASGAVVSIILQGYGLTGTISPSLANLTSLTTLVLTKNALTGPVPAELTTLPELKAVDVSNNNLSGPLPVFPATVKFTYLGNPLLTSVASPPVTSPVSSPSSSPPGVAPLPNPAGNQSPVNSPTVSQQTSKSSELGPVIGGVLGGVLLAILAIFLLCRRKRKKSTGNGMSIHPRGDSGSDSELMKVIVDHSYSSASHQATVSSYTDSLHSGTSSNDHQVSFLTIILCFQYFDEVMLGG